MSEFLILGTLLFNVLDASATIWVVSQGLAHEANPLLVGALASGPLQFIAVKASLVGLSGYLLWRRRDHLIVLCGAYVCFTVYWALVLWFWLSLTT